MSKLEELIKQLCPNGVEYKKLGEIATEIYRGSGIKKDEVTEEGISCVRYGEIYTKYNIYFDKCYSHTILENISSPKYFEHGDILFAITGESVEDIAKSIAYVGNEKCLAGGDIVVMKHNQNPKYLSFALSTTNAVIQKGKGKVKSKVVHSSVPAISEIEVPLPPLKIQNEIANILDKFTELEEELEEELEARCKQYEYYRNSLLTFGENVEWKTLGEIATKIIDGMHNLPNCVSEKTDFPVISAQNVSNGSVNFETNKYVTEDIFNIENKRTNVECGDVLLTIVGAIGRLAIMTEQKCLFQRSICVIKPNYDFVSSMYLKFVLESDSIQKYIQLNAHGAAQKGIYLEQVKKIRIPVPPLSEQERIVKILDKFESLCNDITQGLPAEIEMRKKQYEYYRDKLLTFEKIA